MRKVKEIEGIFLGGGDGVWDSPRIRGNGTE